MEIASVALQLINGYLRVGVLKMIMLLCSSTSNNKGVSQIQNRGVQFLATMIKGQTFMQVEVLALNYLHI